MDSFLSLIWKLQAKARRVVWPGSDLCGLFLFLCIGLCVDHSPTNVEAPMEAPALEARSVKAAGRVGSRVYWPIFRLFPGGLPG